MRIKEVLFLFAKSLNPGDYKILVTRKKRDVVKYFLLIIFYFILISMFLSIPKIIETPNKVKNLLANFDNINVSFEIKAKEKVILIEFPKIALDLRDENKNSENMNLNSNETNKRLSLIENSLTNNNLNDEYNIENNNKNSDEINIEELILITNKYIYIKKFNPGFLKLFETETKNLEEYKDLKKNFSNLPNATYWFMFIILLPSIIFFVYLFNLIKFTILVFIVSLIGYLFIKLKRKKLSFFSVIITAVYSCSIMIFTDIIVLPFFKFSIYLSLLSFMLYLLLFILSLMVLCEKEINIIKEV